MKGYSFFVEGDTSIGKALSELVMLADKKSYIVSGFGQKGWSVFISYASYGDTTSAFCEAHGSPAKVQIIVNLDRTLPNMYTWGCFNKGFHKIEKVQGKAEPVFELLKEKFLSIADRYDELIESTTD